MADNFAAKTIPLGKDDRLVFDRADGFYRVAYYRPRHKREQGPPERRWATKERGLLDAITTVLGEAEAPHDPLTVEHYIRSTAWGRQLP